MRSILRSCLALSLGLAALPALASFEISSSISDSISESVGSVSASIRTSSESVSGDTKTARGPYEVMDVQAVADRVVMLAHGRVVADEQVAELGDTGLEKLFLERLSASIQTE